MKQRVTIEQLNQLSAVQKGKVQHQWKPDNGDRVLYRSREGVITGIDSLQSGGTFFVETIDKKWRALLVEKKECLPLLSIGQMVELMAALREDGGVSLNALFPSMGEWTADELSDRLFEAIRSHL
ncbi:hypothetical protein [Paenibacillus sp. J2TS4]|uniref:hypothetical protein n=1 Tax=Paenibacillus sp. J2TS4 TaxID=2807194 RepID=UPI001B012EB8|nr:hypothetical protein [Paenibacillus sp. J2TS4]GIP31589.1 hypothetical protein J2TS4_07990 [Paenibacillus sp. J2TS4]